MTPITEADLPLTDLETVLTTTRAVRRRLDFDRPVARETLVQCLDLALQAPTGGGAEDWRFVVVGDAEVRARLGELYLRAYREHVERPLAESLDHPVARGRLRATRDGATARMLDGARILAENLGRAPYLVIPCATRPNPAVDPTAGGVVAGVYGSVFPAVWSLQLALRSRGLGSVITTLHLHHEAEAAELLGIPDGVTQCCLLPVAHTIGLDFRPAARRPQAEVVFWDHWSSTDA